MPPLPSRSCACPSRQLRTPWVASPPLPGSSKLTSSGRDEVMCTTFSCSAPRAVLACSRLRVRRFTGWLHASVVLLAFMKNLARMPPPKLRVALVTPCEWQASNITISWSARLPMRSVSVAHSRLTMTWRS